VKREGLRVGKGGRVEGRKRGRDVGWKRGRGSVKGRESVEDGKGGKD
jgi:hypothetical protein